MNKELKTNRKENLKVLSRIFSAHKEFRGKIALMAFFHLLEASSYAIAPIYIAALTNSLSRGEEWNTIGFYLVVIALFALAGVLISQVRMWYEVKYLDCQIPDLIAKRTFGHLETLSIGQHRNEHSVVTDSKISNGQSSVKNFFDILVYNVIPMMSIAFIAMFVICINYPVPGFIVLFFGLLCIVAGIDMARKFSKPLSNLADYRNKYVKKSGTEYIRHIDSLKVSVEEKRYAERHFDHRETRKVMHIKLFKRFCLYLFRGQSIIQIGRVSALISVSYMIYLGRYDIGALTAVIAWSRQVFHNLHQTQRLSKNLMENWADIVHYNKIMDTVPDIKQPENAIRFDSLIGRFDFENVFFSYGEDNILKDINFSIEPGQKVGIVGPSGAGKSTLISLLQLAYLPTLGHIRVDGIDLSNVSQKSYREKIGFIEQKPLLFDQSLRDNLLFGLSDERRNNTTNEDLIKILKEVGLSNLVDRLDSRIGEFGIKVSGGEGQRVAIARLILKKPDVLIIDEATSHVDTINEGIIHELLDKVSPGATRIVIAHRLSAVIDSDVIFVVDDGSIVSKGTHRELLEECKLYERIASKSIYAEV